MATFTKRNTRTGTTPRRTFVRRSTSTPKPRAAAKKPKDLATADVSSSASVEHSAGSMTASSLAQSLAEEKALTPSVVSPPPAVEEEPDIFLEQLAKKRQEYFTRLEQPKQSAPPLTPHKTNPVPAAKDDEIADVQALIQQATQRLAELEQNAAQRYQEQEVDEVEVEAFNGLSSSDERIQLLEAELEKSRRESVALKKQLQEIQTSHERDKHQFDKTIKNLRKDMHREAPLHQTKFFSLSNELKEAIGAIEKLADTNLDEVDTSLVAAGVVDAVTPDAEPTAEVAKPIPEEAPKAEAATQPEPKQVVKEDKETAQPDPVPESQAKSESEPAAKKPKAKKKKLLITGVAAVAVLIFLSGIFSLRFGSSPNVDEALVQEYLNQQTDGQVQGVSTQAPQAEGQEPAAVAGTAQPSKMEQAQAEVAFEQTVWETVTEPIFGIKVDYPSNSVNIIKTDSSLTFVRKSGYIFKLQRIDTALELDEYWKQIKATSLNYKESEAELGKQKALHLQLEDATDYPGDRYLVKVGDAIFDVWYATPSDKFDQDDIKRVERMMNSVEFIGADGASVQ